MTKAELIDTVREYNITASVAFLEQFQAFELKEYLDHLLEAKGLDLIATPANHV